MTQLLYLLGSVCCSDSSTRELIEVELHALPEQLRGFLMILCMLASHVQMSLLANSSSQVCCSRPRAASRGQAARAATCVRAAIWTPNQQSDALSRGRDRPWIEANGQPILAPRTADMAGDPFGLLLRQRIVFLGGEVEDFGADALVSQLLLLDNQDQTKDIKMFINSPGELQALLAFLVAVLAQSCRPCNQH